MARPLRSIAIGGVLVALVFAVVGLTGAVASLIWPDSVSEARFAEVERRALMGVVGE